MPHSIDLAAHEMVALTRASLAALRSALFRDAGPAAAAYLQEAGYAGGEALFASFGSWLRAQALDAPEDLDVKEFERHASAYFRDAGWGTLQIGALADAVAILDSVDWGEADPESGLDIPGCHLTTGMFADFFGRIAETPLAVLEVECRSTGAPRCRFLLGNTEVMVHIYDQLGRGASYEQAVTEVE
ncbi:MAG TPA: V4R domain-containing protein [Gemmatimonadaceae bacterium]|nr:V4R domain-containing protein [Gemmatimonadaceae bacterium]